MQGVKWRKNPINANRQNETWKSQTQMRLPLLGTAASPAVHEITEADLAPINLMYYLPSINYELYLNSLVQSTPLHCFTLKQVFFNINAWVCPQSSTALYALTDQPVTICKINRPSVLLQGSTPNKKGFSKKNSGIPLVMATSRTINCRTSAIIYFE